MPPQGSGLLSPERLPLAINQLEFAREALGSWRVGEILGKSFQIFGTKKPWNIKMLNTNSWRFGADDFLFELFFVMFRFHLTFGVT